MLNKLYTYIYFLRFNFNDELFDVLTPYSVLSWQRVRAAHWLARSGGACGECWLAQVAK